METVNRSDRKGLPVIGGHSSYDVTLWLLTLLFFVWGDSTTTFIGTETSGVTEANPLLSMIFSEFGFGFSIFVALKIVVFIIGLWTWASLSEQYRSGIPLLLAIHGTTLTFWNLFIILPHIG